MVKNKKTKVVHILWSFGNGGMENIVKSLLIPQNKNYQSSLILVNEDEDKNATKDIPPETILRINRKRGSKNIFKILKLLITIISFRPDIIHIHYFDLIKWINPLKKIINFKIVITIHGMSDYNKSIKHCDAVVFVSHEHQNTILNQCITENIPTNNFNMIYNGIEIPKFLKKDAINLNQLKFVCIGRLNHLQKRQDIILKAFKDLLKSYPNTTMTFYGSGISEEYLIKLKDKLKLFDNVFFKGSVENKEMIKHMHNYDVMISASKVETFGLNIIECLSIGIPVITYPAPAIKEITKDNPLAIYYSSNEKLIPIVEKKLSIISNKEREISKRIISNNFDINLMKKKYYSLYEKIL